MTRKIMERRELSPIEAREAQADLLSIIVDLMRTSQNFINSTTGRNSLAEMDEAASHLLHNSDSLRRLAGRLG